MRTIVYVSNLDGGEVSVLAMARDSGALTPLQQAHVGGKCGPLALRRDTARATHLYAARRSEPFAAVGFAIRETDGLLEPIGEQALPQSMAYLATDRTGRFLFGASYGGNLLAIHPIDADGRVGPLQQLIPTEPKAHAVCTDPANRHLFATSLGGDHVLQFHFDGLTGRVRPNRPPLSAVHPGAGPRHLAFHPGGPWVYVVCELDGSLLVFDRDELAGTLRPRQTTSVLPPGFGDTPWAADLHLTPDGRLLYTSERRSSTLAAFAVDPADGSLTPLGHTTTETEPRGFAIDPRGRFLLAAGQASHHVSVYAIDARDGRLDARHRLEVGRGPHWIEIVDLD